MSGYDESVIDVEAVAVEEVGTELVVSDVTSPPSERQSMTLFGTDDPVEVLEKATRAATALADVIERKKLYAMIQGKKHPTIEAWTLLGSMLGVFARPVWTRRVEIGSQHGWEARVEVVTRNGDVIGGREAMCVAGESKQWHANSDEHALRSMAQTRANSAALAGVLRFVMILGGYQGTPDAEMPGVEEKRKDPEPPAPPRSWAAAERRLAEAVGGGESGMATAGIYIVQMIKALTGKTYAELSKDEKATALQSVARGVLLVEQATAGGDFPPPNREQIGEALAPVVDGEELVGPDWRLGPDEDADVPTYEEWKADHA